MEIQVTQRDGYRRAEVPDTLTSGRVYNCVIACINHNHRGHTTAHMSHDPSLFMHAEDNDSHLDTMLDSIRAIPDLHIEDLDVYLAGGAPAPHYPEKTMHSRKVALQKLAEHGLTNRLKEILWNDDFKAVMYVTLYPRTSTMGVRKEPHRDYGLR